MDHMEIVEKIYEMFGAADIDGIMALTSPEIVVRQDAALPWGGTYVGRDGVIDFAMKLMATTESTVSPKQVFAAGDSVVQIERTRRTVRSSGAEFDIPECHVWTFRDGVVVDAQFFIDSTAMLEVLGP